MARIFISHSSANNAVALALRDWLVSEGWDDLFLDVDPARGIVGGERWERALNEAASRCEAVLFLVSRAWLGSQWCLKEFHLAQKLNKQMFGILVEAVPMEEIPAEVKATWQLVDLAAGADHAMFRVVLPDGREEHLTLSKSGLTRLKTGLAKAGLDARFFPWPPEDDPDRPPYRGMRPLEAEDAGIFFGREAPTIAALDRLRGLAEAAPPRFVVVLGASGAGKSSYLRAGLLPRLERDDRHFLALPIVRPERAAISGDSGLLRSLEAAAKARGLKRSRADLKAAIAAGAPAVAALLADLGEAARVPGLGDEAAAAPRIVLPVDQGEELFAAEGAEEADAFLRLVHDLVTDPGSNLIVLVTIRSDAYEQLQTAAPLEGIRQETLSLPPMPRGAYQTVIEGPAARLRDTARALKIEPALTAALLADIEAGGGKDALPLLAFTLERLYLEFGGDGDLRLDEYEQLGRIRGSINAAVEGALKAADADPAVPRDRAAREALLRRALIPWLAGIDPETGSPRRRVARVSEIPEEARPLIAHLIDARLLATDRMADSGEVTIEPAHEALLRQWGLLEGWLEEDFAALSALEGVRRATRDWDANARDAAWLAHTGGRLEDAEALLARDDFGRSLDTAARAYLAAARAVDTARRNRELEEARKLAEAERVAAERQRQVARRTRVGLFAASLLALAAVGAAVYGFDQANRADEQAALASEQAEIASANQKEAEVSAARLAVTVASAAIDRGDTDTARDLLLTAAESFDDATAPDAMLLAFHRLNEAMEAKQVYPLPEGAVVVEGPDALYFIDVAAGDVLRFDGTAAPAVVFDGSPDESPIRKVRVLDEDKGMVIVREDGTVLRATAPGSEPGVAGSVALMPAGVLETYERDAELSIERDGVVIVRHFEGDPSLQILDTATGHALASSDEMVGTEYIVLPEGRSFLMYGLRVEELVDTGEALALVHIETSEEDAQWLLLQGCFLDAGSTPPEELPELDVMASSGYFDHSCKATPDGVIHTYYSSGSAGVGRYDEIVRPGEEPVNLATVIDEISSYDLRHNFAWSGYDPAIRAYTVLVNRDLLVFDEYTMDLIRKHPVEVGPARILGDGRIAIVESAANRVTVRDITGNELRAALSRDDEAAVAAGDELLMPLNKGTCVGYALGSGGTFERDYPLPDGATLTVAGSTGTSSDGPPRVTIIRGEDRQDLTLGDEEACIQFSSDWKRAVTVTFENVATVIDFERFRAGATLAEATIGVLPGTITSAFPLADGSIVTSANEGAVSRWRQDEAGDWTPTELYRGDYPVFYAEPDAAAERLLLIEGVGGGDARGFLYSVPAAARWLELGSDYKWFGEAFAEDGGIAAGAGRVQRFIDLPVLGALVAETAARAGGEDS